MIALMTAPYSEEPVSMHTVEIICATLQTVGN
jgi:hypothetical protein